MKAENHLPSQDNRAFLPDLDPKTPCKSFNAS